MEKRGSKDKIFFLGFLLLVLVFLVIFTYVKDCGDDKACFADSASSCKKVKVVLESDSAVYSYEILGKKSEDCVILVTLNRITSQVEPKLKQQLEGKKMVCAVQIGRAHV